MTLIKTIVLHWWKTLQTSSGLYELVFMKHHNENVYDENDLAAYKEVLREIKAHKHSNLQGARIKTSGSYKYKEIISKLFLPRGRGIHYVHCNDPTNWWSD